MDNQASESIESEVVAPVEIEAPAEPEVVEAEAPETEAPAEFVDITYNGETYSVPKELSDGFLMQQDYTKKTMTLAEQRKAVEAEREMVRKQTEYQQGLIQEIATVKAYDEQLKVFEGMDWATLSQKDPAKAQSLWITYTQLKDGREEAQRALQNREQAWVSERQQIIARRAEHAQSILRNEIKGWGPELAKELGDFAMSKLGFSQNEISQVDDPRVIKLIHKAYLGEKLVESKTPKPKVKAVKPNKSLSGSGSGAAPDPNNMSMDDWVKHRNKQLFS